METINYRDYQQLLKGPHRRYYLGRWKYYKEVLGIINDLRYNSALELGPAQQPIVKDSDVMIKPEDDRWGRPITKAPKEWLHDATEKPWPIRDKQYDLFIALQVWEHLGNKQSQAFREVMRISKMAILSFPYLWDCPKNNANYPEHHMIDEDLIGDWTLNVKPERVIKVNRAGLRISKGPRIIYFWRFKNKV